MGEVDMAGECGHFQIVHACPLQRPVGHVEPGRLDDVYGNAQASGHAQDRAGVAGNVRLVEGDTQVQFQAFLNSGASATLCQDATKISVVAVAISRERVYRAAIFNANRRRNS